MCVPLLIDTNNAEKHFCCNVKDKGFLERTYFPFLTAGEIIPNSGGLPDVPAEDNETIYKKMTRSQINDTFLFQRVLKNLTVCRIL